MAVNALFRIERAQLTGLGIAEDGFRFDDVRKDVFVGKAVIEILHVDFESGRIAIQKSAFSCLGDGGELGGVSAVRVIDGIDAVGGGIGLEDGGVDAGFARVRKDGGSGGIFVPVGGKFRRDTASAGGKLDRAGGNCR